jgi:hypothetical protein
MSGKNRPRINVGGLLFGLTAILFICVILLGRTTQQSQRVIASSQMPPSAHSEQLATDSKEDKLTPERAKEALLKMIRSKAGEDLGWFEGDIPDEMAKMKIEEENDGWYAWTGAFSFNPSKASYRFVVRPRPGARACMFEYEGSFGLDKGAWFATQPKLLRTAMQSGR